MFNAAENLRNISKLEPVLFHDKSRVDNEE